MQRKAEPRAERMQKVWLEIHGVAAEQCLALGPDGVSTAKIAELAGISPRTFFNYFATKEDAILGLGRIHLDDEFIREFLEIKGLTPLQRVVVLTARVLGTAFMSSADPVRRQELAEKYPELLARTSYSAMHARELVMRALITEADELWLGAEGMPTNKEEAYALVVLSFSMVAFAWQSDPGRLAVAGFEMLNETIALFTKVLNQTG
ncbi:MAG: TetR/AcrR family transcriptional regulator [Aeromicrobium sp.]|nr:MAG: TetR/AcrR family transcriptional regulator [Aeromicrobium sp.]